MADPISPKKQSTDPRKVIIKQVKKQPPVKHKVKVHSLYRHYERDIVNKLLAQPDCELEIDFPGFVHIYHALSKIVPRSLVVIDFGCYMAPQCWFFRKHIKYIGVDITTLKRFSAGTFVEHHISSIEDWIENHYNDYNPKACFAICSYVGYKQMKLVSEKYPNCYCFFPNNPDMNTPLKGHNVKLGDLHVADDLD